jgi:hypothetical protein
MSNALDVLASGMWPTLFAGLFYVVVVRLPCELAQWLNFGVLGTVLAVGLGVVAFLACLIVNFLVTERLYPGVTPEMWHMGAHARRD